MALQALQNVPIATRFVYNGQVFIYNNRTNKLVSLFDQFFGQPAVTNPLKIGASGIYLLPMPNEPGTWYPPMVDGNPELRYDFHDQNGVKRYSIVRMANGDDVGGGGTGPVPPGEDKWVYRIGDNMTGALHMRNGSEIELHALDEPHMPGREYAYDLAGANSIWKEAPSLTIQTQGHNSLDFVNGASGTDTVLVTTNNSQVSTVDTTAIWPSDGISLSNNATYLDRYVTSIRLQSNYGSIQPEKALTVYDVAHTPPFVISAGTTSASVTFVIAGAGTFGGNPNGVFGGPGLNLSIVGYTDSNPQQRPLASLSEACINYPQGSQTWITYTSNPTYPEFRTATILLTPAGPIDDTMYITGFTIQFNQSMTSSYYTDFTFYLSLIDIVGVSTSSGTNIDCDIQSLTQGVRIKAASDIVLHDSAGFVTLNEILKACGLRS